MPPVVDHDCVLLDVVKEQSQALQQAQERIDKLEQKLAQLLKAHVGPKSERTKKMPSIDEALGTPSTTPEQKQHARRERAEARKKLPSVRVDHKVPDDQRDCPKCGHAKLEPLGGGRVTETIEYIPARILRVEHVQEVLRCRCGGHVVTAPGAPKVVEQGRYGASVLAFLVVAKCVDHLPIYRLEKAFARAGLPMKRSTMNELFHRAAEVLAPISNELLLRISRRHVVQADETRLRMLDDGTGKPKNGFVWTFVAADDDGAVDVGYRFAPDRSATTAVEVLGKTLGYLIADGYAGYNAVIDVDSRIRAACHAHLRRYFHEALSTAPQAQEAIDLILELYRVEHEAKERGIVGTDSHLDLRKERSGPARDRLKAWLDKNLDLHPPKSPIGIGIRYGLKQWAELGRFLDDAGVPLDNNASERALRRVALGRKNYLFVGDAKAGANIAGLYSLAATCEARGINPFEYLADVTSRVGDHPAKRLGELLPGAWAAAQT